MLVRPKKDLNSRKTHNTFANNERKTLLSLNLVYFIEINLIILMRFLKYTKKSPLKPITMSRGFVKEDDQEEIPLVPPRAHLPEGVTNYVTPVGLKGLLDEKEKLVKELAELKTNNDNERRIATNHINAKLNLLNDRIFSAKVIEPNKQAADEVRFGAIVTLQMENAPKPQKYQITGVDEADIAKGKISFISPLAKTLTNKKVGDKAVLKLPKGKSVFEILEIAY